MRKNILLLFVCFSCFTSVMGQITISYDSDGKVSEISNNKKSSANIQGVLPDERDLRIEAKKALYDKCKKTIELLQPGSDLYEFYKLFWTVSDIDVLRKELLAIATENTAAYGRFTFLQELVNKLPVLDSPIFNTIITDDQIKLTHKNVINDFLLQYYNQTISLPANISVKTLSLADYITLSDFITHHYINIASALTKARGLISETNRILLVNTGNYKTDVTYSSLTSYLNIPWFKQWLWYNEGLARLNPFEFATNSFFEKFPQFDVLKHNLYETYIDTMLQRRIRLDTVSKLEEVRTLLKEKSISDKRFSYLDKIDKIKAENKEHLQNLNRVEILLNKSVFPTHEKNIFKKKTKELVPFLYYTVDKDLKGAYGNIEESRTVSITDRKNIIVFNVPPNVYIDLMESTTPYDNKSPFRSFTDEFAANVTDLLPGLKNASDIVTAGFSGLRSTRKIVPDKSNIPSNPLAPGASRFTSTSLPVLKDIVSKHLKLNDLYNDALFRDLVDNNIDNFTTMIRSIRRYNDAAFNQAINLYTKHYIDDLYNPAIDDASRDSMALYFFSNIIVNSTLPFPKINADNSKNPVFTTFSGQTSTSDKPKIKNVRIVARSGKDSSEIETFKYNMGERQRYQLTAGLAYTFPDPVVNEVKEENGKIILNQKKEPLKVVVGINFYPFSKGLFLQSNSAKFSADRISLYIAMGIPKPLQSVYAGLSYDIVPSIRISGGVNLNSITNYEIKNDQIAKTSKTYKPYSFVSLGFDPISFINMINIFK